MILGEMSPGLPVTVLLSVADGVDAPTAEVPPPAVADISCDDPPLNPACIAGRKLSFIWATSRSAAFRCFSRTPMSAAFTRATPGFLTVAPALTGPSLVCSAGSIVFPLGGFACEFESSGLFPTSPDAEPACGPSSVFCSPRVKRVSLGGFGRGLKSVALSLSCPLLAFAVIASQILVISLTRLLPPAANSVVLPASERSNAPRRFRIESRMVGSGMLSCSILITSAFVTGLFGCCASNNGARTKKLAITLPHFRCFVFIYRNSILISKNELRAHCASPTACRSRDLARGVR